MSNLSKVIVVGGGLSGLSAAHTVLENGGRVLVLDKNSFFGGNSTKATSGINGALTKTQIKLGIQDSVEKFYEDTAKSARDLLRPELVRVLTGNSGPAVEWLQDKFKLDLSLVSRLGGHSFPRTHRGKERFPGMTITYALMEKFEEIAKQFPDRAVGISKAKVVNLIKDGEKVIGVEYEKEGKLFKEYGVVILATGGYAADFTDTSLLKKYRPDIYDLPTTNGDYSTGDGIKMALTVGANAIDLEKVQVHPTGLVDPKEPDAKVKFLAAEALRGVGGLLLNKEGDRFCDELGHRDYVTGKMWENKRGPYRLVLNSAASKEIEWHCKHYSGRGLMKFFNSGAELAKEMGISADKLKDTFSTYNSIAKNKNDPFGKKYFDNVPFDLNDKFYVAIVTPVLHFCMGGVEIDEESHVLAPNKKPVPGLFASGEVAGGVHGANRLGGSSLLGCVVFGRVAGNTASRYLLSSLLSQPQSTVERRTSTLGNQIGDFKVGATISPQNNSVKLEISWPEGGSSSSSSSSSSSNEQAVSTSTSTPAPSSSTPAPSSNAAPSKDPNKVWTLEEVSKHNKPNDCWVIVNGQVLDVTSFLKDHPGGSKAILLFAGRDASEEFNMLHKPDVVEKYAPESIIGKIGGSSSSSSHGEAPKAPVSEMKPSNVESFVSGGTADVLPEERSKASFETLKLTHLLDGGPEATKRRYFITKMNEDVDASVKFHQGRPEQFKEHIKHFIAVHKDFANFKPTRNEIIYMTDASIMGGALMNHYGLFLPTIEMQASDQQKEWWAARTRKMEIIGSYAQTELGHGSNVRGLQTVAEYDKTTQEFVLNTPTLRSIKWWPGALGKVATHAVTYAQLIIEGKEYGVHAFMLQIRDENHKPLPGIELGDLGPKLGDHANDTGFMRLKNVRIPREYMLARFQEVTPEGKYVKSEMSKKNARLHYATMMFTRGTMIKSAGGYLARCAVIATRYSCIRTQGFVDPKPGVPYKSQEVKIIDYQVQRYRVMKQVAMSYAIKFTGTSMLDRFAELEKGGLGISNEGAFDIIPELAATSAGLKALTTILAWTGIEDCRKCCGGNGYLMSAGIANIAADYVWQTTAEGDFIILMLQTAQYLIKSIQGIMKGGKSSELTSYLNPLADLGSFKLTQHAPAPVKTTTEFANLDYLQALFRFNALAVVAGAGQQFQKKMGATGGNFTKSLNECSLELLNAVRAHCGLFMLNSFVKQTNSATDKNVKTVLSKLCALYACTSILDDQHWHGILTPSQLVLAKSTTIKLMEEIRPDIIALTDAFDIPDRVLNSDIGRFDGNIYEALWTSAQKSVLNQVDPFEGYEEVLRPHLDIEFMKLHNKLPSNNNNNKSKL